MVSSSTWDSKFEPAERTNVLNPIRHCLERNMKPDPNHALPMINLGLGEPSKANGFTLPPQINEAIMEAVQSGNQNSYT
jgi:aspartate/methionine/tyrosine aminotransferase